jgi:hypothetical protein
MTDAKIPCNLQCAGQEETEDNWAGEQQWTDLMDILRNLQTKVDHDEAPLTCESPVATRAHEMFRRLHKLLHVIKGDLVQFKLEKAQFEVEKARFDLEKARFELENSMAGSRRLEKETPSWTQLPSIRDPQAPHQGDPDKVVDTHPYHFLEKKEQKENPNELHKFTKEVLVDAKQIIKHNPSIPDPHAPHDVENIESRRAEQISTDSLHDSRKIMA